MLVISGPLCCIVIASWQLESGKGSGWRTDRPHEASTTTLLLHTKTIFNPTKCTNLIIISVHKMAQKTSSSDALLQQKSISNPENEKGVREMSTQHAVQQN